MDFGTFEILINNLLVSMYIIQTLKKTSDKTNNSSEKNVCETLKY